MTLLEALVALVVLGLSTVGYLEVFQAATRSGRATGDWIAAAARAEAAMEDGVAARRRGLVAPAVRDGATRVDVVPLGGSLEDVVATVRLPDGQVLVVHRLVRSR